MTERPNVILLSIDALRADHFGYHGYERDTSPFLDSLAERSVNFETAISASSHTREAVPTLLTGRYPDIFAENGYRCVTKTVADRLSADGYATAGFHSNPYVSRAYGYDSGFDTFDDDLRLGQHRLVALFQRALDKFLLNKGAYHARAETINQRSLEWLDSLKSEPFFLWNHYMDPHGPYNPIEGYTYADRELSNSEAHAQYQKIIDDPESVTDTERDLLVDCYDGEIRYLDEHLETFFTKLDDRGILEESLVIVTADHGDAFGEHGYYTHPRYLHECLIHIPLLVSTPGETQPAALEVPVSTLDIVPTILDCVDASDDELPGESLLNLIKHPDREHREFAIASATGEDEHEGVRRFAARGTRWKVVMERDIETGDIIEEVAFDLETDKSERKELPITEVEADRIVEELQTLSSARLESPRENANVDSRGTASAELDDRLEALGYK